MSLVKNLVIENTSYPIRDANTYRSLSSTQAIHLDDDLAKAAGTTADGLYNGEEVQNGEIFTKYDGTFVKFIKGTAPLGTYETIEESITTASDIIVTPLTIVRAYDNNKVVYSEDDGETWEIATINGTDFTGSVKKFGHGKTDDEIIAAGNNGNGTSVFLSEDGGKTWTEKSTFNNTYGIMLAGYLNSVKKYVVIALNNYNEIGSIWSSSDLETWSQSSLPGYFQGYNWATAATIYNDEIYLVDRMDQWKIRKTSDFETYDYVGDINSDYDVKLGVLGNNLMLYYTNIGFGYSTDSGATWNYDSNSYVVNGLVDYNNGLYISIKNGKFYLSDDLTASEWNEYDFINYESELELYSNCLPIVHTENKFIFSSTENTALILSKVISNSLSSLSYNKTEVDTALVNKANEPVYNSSTNTLEF